MYHINNILIQAERTATKSHDIPTLLSILRKLPFDDFAEFFITLPRADFPNLSRMLPKMADAETQKNWTGADGIDLLHQTIAFTRSVAEHYAAIRGRPLAGEKILDYGCGWGRIIRTMYYYSNPDTIYGCDPWDESISRCREANIQAHLTISDYLPKSIPFDVKFDLIYAFSVFTHLSRRATESALSALRKSISFDGLLVITIRPVEYWELSEEMHAAHLRDGFAFKPHQRQAMDGDITYGDTSMSPEFIMTNFAQWRLVGIDRSLCDPHQIYVFLQSA